MKRQSSLLGQSVPRVDAYDKVTGRSKFTADLFPPNCLVAKVVLVGDGPAERRDESHGKVRADTHGCQGQRAAWRRKDRHLL